MFEIKTNEEIGAYLKQLIISKYPSCRQFCKDYIDLTMKFLDDDQRCEEIRKLTNRLSQILNGKKGIQTYDLPVFSELLDVSCEQMLSAGAVCKPIANRKTNYNIAMSSNQRDWDEYLNREDRVASYADEFGKTIVDYAIEFKNYDFIRFLIDKGYITLISERQGFTSLNFGASTKIKPNIYPNTLEKEMYENIILRTQIISLAIQKKDYLILNKMKAREFPTQRLHTAYHSSIKLNNYYDEKYIDSILHSDLEVIKYFCEEYNVTSEMDNTEYMWIFPFLDKLIVKAVKENNNSVMMLIEAAIKHNEKVYKDLKRAILKTVQLYKKSNYNKSIELVINNICYYYCINEEKNAISYYYYENSEKIATNIIYIDIKSTNLQIQNKIDEVNELYSKITNIKNHLIKK